MKKAFRSIKEEDLLSGLRKLKNELQMLREELASDRSANPQAEKNIRFLVKELFPESGRKPASGRDPGLIRRASEIPSKEAHYGRNDIMPISSLPQSPEIARACHWDGSVGAACHQFSSPDKSNIKFVSPDGHSEVIFDSSGQIVTVSEDYGTYNFADSRQDPVGHFYNDVLPWLLWGNDGKDSTQMRQRLRALVIDGGIEAAQSRVKKEPGEP